MRRRLVSVTRVCGVVLLCGATFILGVFWLPRSGAVPIVHTVNSTGDAGDADLKDGIASTGGLVGGAPECTLRAAIQQANHTGGEHDIEFNIPGAGVHTISPVAALPAITSAARILGYTQPGSSPAAMTAGGIAATIRIALAGGTGPAKIGLVLRGAGCRVEGLSITGFQSGGVALAGGSSTVSGNFIGLAPDGAAAGNLPFGVQIQSGSHTISTNVISGHSLPVLPVMQAGIATTGGTASILGNHIGTDPTGAQARANVYGILSQNGSQTIEGNLISANTVCGIACLVNAPSDDTRIANNRIVGNGSGIQLDNQVGSTSNAVRFVVEDNEISGSQGGGILFPDGDLIRGNTIVDNSGGPGIHIDRGGNNRVVGNTIARNTWGIWVGTGRPTSVGNTSSRNLIFGNSNLQIDLAGEGGTPNDPGDLDTGPNGLQNYPVLLAVVPGTTEIFIEGILESAPSSAFTLEFFSADGWDAYERGQAQRIVGSGVVATDSGGAAPFQFRFPAGVGGGRYYSATATASDGSTSEISECFVVQLAPGEIEFAQARYEGTERGVGENEIALVPITITRRVNASGDASVLCSTSNGTALAVQDYLETAQVVEFEDGEVSQEILVFIRVDDTFEPDESFRLTLSSPWNAVVGLQSTAEVVILNDDTVTVGFELGEYHVSEGAGTATFRVVLDQALAVPVTAECWTVYGSAAAGEDYSDTIQYLEIPAGRTEVAFPVEILQDNLWELPETLDLRVIVRDAGVERGANAIAVLYIDDDDGSPGVVQFEEPFIELPARELHDYTFFIRMVRTGGITGELRYLLDLSGSAEEGTDYFFSGGEDAKTVIFPDGVNQATREIQIIDDGVPEGAEYILLTLLPQGGSIVGRFRTATIENLGLACFGAGQNAGCLSVSAPGDLGYQSVIEGRAFECTVHRHGSVGSVTVDVLARDVTSVQGADYVFGRRTLTWADGDETPQTLRIQANADGLAEGEEEFDILLVNPTGGAFIDGGRVRCLIEDGDTPNRGVILVTHGDDDILFVREDAGTLLIRVDRRDGSDGEVGVSYSTFDLDGVVTRYRPVSSTLVFPDRFTARTIRVPIVDDRVQNEVAEEFLVSLFDPTGGASLDAFDRTIRVVVRDNDRPGFVPECVVE